MLEQLRVLWAKCMVSLANNWPGILRHLISAGVTFTSIFIAVFLGLLETHSLNNLDNLSWGALASILITGLRSAVKILYERVLFPKITAYLSKYADPEELKKTLVDAQEIVSKETTEVKNDQTQI